MEDNNNNNNHHPSSSPEEQLIAAVNARDFHAVLWALVSAPSVNVNVLLDEELQRTPMHEAARNGDLEIVLILLDSRHGVNLEARDSEGCTPLAYAVCCGHADVVEALIDRRADLENVDDVHEATPLLNACYQQNEELAMTLIVKGARVDPGDKRGQTALHLACGVDGDRDLWKLVEMLLHNGADVNAKSQNQRSPLHYAARWGKLESMRLLLENGSDLEAKDDSGDSALMGAVCYNELEAVRLLLDAGAEVDSKNSLGRTPLHNVISLEVTEELLNRGTNPCERDKDDWTPFDLAFSNNQPVVYRRILQHYREQVAETYERQSLIAILKEAGYIEVEERRYNETVARKLITLPVGRLTIQLMLEVLLFLVSRVPDMIRAQDNHRSIPLHILCQDAADAPVHLVRWLAEQDPTTLHYGNSFGRLPLHVASHARAPVETIRFLVEQGGVGTLCARDRVGSLPLHCMNNIDAAAGLRFPPLPPIKVDAVEYMIKSYPKAVATPNGNGELPLMLACQSSAPEEILFVLLKAYPQSIDYMRVHCNPSL